MRSDIVITKVVGQEAERYSNSGRMWDRWHPRGSIAQFRGFQNSIGLHLFS